MKASRRDTLAADLARNPDALIDGLGLVRGREKRKVLCPAHAERTPSCSITMGADRTLRVACFGCGFTADAFGLIAQVRGLDTANDFGRVLDEAERLVGRAGQARPTPKAPTESVLADAEFREIIDVLTLLAPLGSSPEVAAYLAGRGLLEPAQAAGWGGLPPPEEQADLVESLRAGFGEEKLIASGLFGRRRGALEFEYPTARVLIPWRAAGVDGVVLNIQRRILGGDGAGPKYVGPRGRPFVEPYGIEDALECLGDGVRVFVVEGAIDVLALRRLLPTLGLEGVVIGLPGASGWRSEWARHMRGGVPILALDGDEAGQRQAAAIKAELLAAGAPCVGILRPKSKDWGEDLARERGLT